MKREDSQQEISSTNEEFQLDEAAEFEQLLESNGRGREPLKKLFAVQLPNLVLLGIDFLAFFVAALLRGGKGMQSVIGVESCTAPGWLLFLGGQSLLLILSIVGSLMNRNMLCIKLSPFQACAN